MPWSLESYEAFVYRISELSSHINFSTLTVQRRGKRAGLLQGEIVFEKNIVAIIYENLGFIKAGQDFIVDYSYEVKIGSETQYWYDSQPHPNNPALQSTHPHHKHIPPDIKHHRIPAPGLSFREPNLPFLIREIESLFFA